LIRRGKEGSSLEESCSFSFWRRGEKGCIVLLRGGRVVELGETREGLKLERSLREAGRSLVHGSREFTSKFARKITNIPTSSRHFHPSTFMS
jgi:hypothetical protein